MYSHGVNCSHPCCSDSATYKVAAHWSHGTFAELKTYGFACSDHVGEVFQEAENRRLDYTLRPGEVIEELAIYRFEPGKRDRQLQRLRGLEENYRTWPRCRRRGVRLDELPVSRGPMSIPQSGRSDHLGH